MARMQSFNPLDHPICLSSPLRIVPSTWISHVPFGMLLVDIIKPKVLVELGTYYGVSYCGFCQAIRELKLDSRCYAIDTWEGDPQSGYYGPEVLDDLKKYHDPLYGSFSQLIVSSFDNALPHFQERTIDLLHFDGYHRYENVKHDFESWLPKMSDRGVILMHDTNVREKDFGVWRLWDELKSRYHHFELMHGSGLGLLVVGNEPPESLLKLVNASPEVSQGVINFFHRIGQHLEVSNHYENKIRSIVEDRDNLLIKLAEKEQDLHGLNTQVEKRCKEVATLQDHVKEIERSVQSLNEKIEEKKRAEKDLQAQVGEAVKKVSLLESNVVQKEKLIKTLQARFEEERSRLNLNIREKNRKLEEINNSTAWGLVRVLWRLRIFIAPRGSRREDIFLHIKRNMAVLKLEGFQARLKQIVQRNKSEIELVAETSVTSQSSVEEIHPIVSIVIPVYNALPYTKECIRSIYRAGAEVPFEIVIVDNGSTDGTTEWLKSEKKVHREISNLSMEKNLGFARGVNAGIEHSRGEYVAILNNDTLVTKGWLDNILATFHKDPEIGIVSPVTNFVGEGPQIDLNAKDLPPIIEEVERYAEIIKNRNDIIYESNRLVFFCVVLKRELIDIVGTLDTIFEKGNFEDDDYCLRSRIAGFRLAIARNAFVYHHGSVTFEVNKISHIKYMEENRRRFYEKVGRISISTRQNLTSPISSKIKVSVIVRTVRKPLLLQRALRSLVNQTYKLFEVVIVNDGGPNISQYLEPFKSYLHITYVHHNASKGRSNALNSGIEEAKGKWITYLDDDDIIYPWHLETLMIAQEKYDEACFFYTDYNKTLFLEKDDRIPSVLMGIEPWVYSKDELLVENSIPIICWMHSKNCIELVGGVDDSLDRLEDYEFLLRLNSICQFIHIKKVTCEYRFYVDNINSIVRNRGKALEALKYIYKKFPVDEEQLLLRRGKILENMENQIRMINEVYTSMDKKFENEKSVNREVIKIVAGI